MIANTLKLVYRYTERALTPSTFTQMLLSNINKQSLAEIMHNLYMYDSNIHVFDYDYFQRCCYQLLDHQKKMSVSEIITVLRLGQKHNIKNQMIWKHLEAELHNRLFKRMNPLFQEEKLEMDQQIKAIMDNLQKASRDHFNLLTDDFKEDQKNDIETTNAPIKSEPITKQLKKQSKQLINRKKQQDIAKFSFDLVQILIWYGSENLSFLNYLLETQLHPTVIEHTPFATLRFAELLTYICQVNMKIYETHKKQYTARSIKKIYKYQGAYFPQLMKNLNASLSKFSIDDIKYLTQVIRSFPIKKRIHRQQMTNLIAQEWKTRGIGLQQQQKAKLQQLLGKDEKLIKRFNAAHTQIVEEQQSISQDDQQIQKLPKSESQSIK